MKISHIKLFNILLCFWLIIFTQAAFSANFTASVNRNPIEVGEHIQVTFKVDKTDVSNFKAPLFKGFTIMMGPSQSSYTQIINGKVSQSFSYTYVLRAEAPGTYTIPSAEIKSGGETLRSNSIQITVNKASPKSQQQAQQQQGQQSQQGQAQSNSKDIDKQAHEIIAKNLFMKLNVNKSSAYKGEPVYATYKLYVNPELNLINISAPKMPVYNGFWSQEIDISQVNFTTTEIINGVRYKVADLKKVLLFPQQTGDLVVEPLEMEFTVRLRTQSQRSRSRDPFFDDFFDDPFSSGFRDFKYNGRSETRKVNVKALPEPIPAEFGNAVGTYKFTASIDKNKLKTNEPVSLKFNISGSGNLKLVQAPIINLPSDIEQFEPKIDDKISFSPEGMSGEKTYEYIIIPRNPGQFTIPATKFIYFDYKQGKYFTLSSNDILIEVEKGMYSDYGGNNQQGVAMLNSDIRFIKDKTTLSKIGSGFANSIWFYAIAVLPIGAFVFLIYYKRRKEDQEENVSIYNSKYAGKYAKKRFSTARKVLESGDVNKFYEESHKAMLEYLSNKFNVAVAELSKDKIRELVVTENTNTELIADKIITMLKKCEFARYAPVNPNDNPADLLIEGESIIIEMEKK